MDKDKSQKEETEENWDAYVSDNEENKLPVKESKKPILKDKNGDIIINKLEDYREPERPVKEARGDVRGASNYDFGDLSFEEEDEDEQETEKKEVYEDIEETGEEKKQKKKKQKSTKKDRKEDIDDLLKEFGVDTSNIEESKNKKAKAKKPKEELKEKEKEKENESGEDGKPKEKQAKKKKKKAEAPKKTSHVNELKRELIERKEALKKKEKRKGI